MPGCHEYVRTVTKSAEPQALGQFPTPRRFVLPGGPDQVDRCGRHNQQNRIWAGQSLGAMTARIGIFGWRQGGWWHGHRSAVLVDEERGTMPQARSSVSRSDKRITGIAGILL